jgi:lysyl-tRNA synthetase class I
MSDNYDEEPFLVECTTCARLTETTIGWMRSHAEFVCSCGAIMKIDHNFDNPKSESERAIREFLRNPLRKP